MIHLELIFVCVMSGVPERANVWMLWTSGLLQDFVKWGGLFGHSFQLDVGFEPPMVHWWHVCCTVMLRHTLALSLGWAHSPTSTDYSWPVVTILSA